MIRGGSSRLSRRLALVGTVLYALFVIASPFEHHDLQCELKTPQHCTSCTSTQLGSDTQVALTPGAAQLDDAGRASSSFGPPVALLPLAANPPDFAARIRHRGPTGA